MMDKCSSYLRNVTLLMPVVVWMALPLKWVVGYRTAGFVGYALMAAVIAMGWLPALSRWIIAYWRMVLAASILAYVAGFVSVIFFLRRAFL